MRVESISLALAALVLAACRGKEALPLSIAESDFPNRYARAFCETFGACCLKEQFAFGRDSCLEGAMRAGEGVLANTHPQWLYDPRRAGRCIEKLQASWSSCRLTDTARWEWLDACRDIFKGTVAPGGACQSNNDCAESSEGPVLCETNVLMPTPPMPTCVVDRPGQVGEACRGNAGGPFDPNTPYPHFLCADGLYCGETPPQSCQPRRGLGEECHAHDAACRAELWCRPTSVDTGNCEARGGPGAACDSDSQCASNDCLKNLCNEGMAPDAMLCGSGGRTPS